MKKKNILEEGTVRRFMRLANLGTLSENYFDEEEVVAEEELEDEEVVDEVPEEEPMDAEEPDFDAEEVAEEPAVPLDVATDVVEKVSDALSSALGVPVEVTSGPEEETMGEPEMDVEPEVPVDVAPVDAVDDEEPAEDAEAYRNEEAQAPCGKCGHVVAGAEEEVVAEEEAETEEEVVSEDEGPQTITNEELVSYISQRVAKRLEEKKKA